MITIDQILELYAAYSTISNALLATKDTLSEIDGKWDPYKYNFFGQISASVGNGEYVESRFHDSLISKIQKLCTEANVIACCEDQLLLPDKKDHNIVLCESCGESMTEDKWILPIEENEEEEND